MDFFGFDKFLPKSIETNTKMTLGYLDRQTPIQFLLSKCMEGLNSLRSGKAGKNFSVFAENVSVYARRC
jgi:hypothetical protein